MREVVVDRLRNADTGDWKAERCADLRHLERGVHRIVAAVVEKVADVVGAEDLDQPLVLAAVLVDTLQLEARRAEGARGGVLQAADGRSALASHIDQIFSERANDAVAS